MAPGESLGFDKLNEGNYPTWKWDAEAYLRSQLLWGVTIGKYPRPVPIVQLTPPSTTPGGGGTVTIEPSQSDINDWEKVAEKATGAILRGIESSQRGLVLGVMDDPKAMWDALAAHHEQKRPATRFASYESLLSVQKRDNESLPALAVRVESALTAAQNARSPDFTLAQLDNDLACMALIRALPAKEYSHFCSLLLMKETITLASLKDALFLEEANRRSSVVDSAAALAASSSSSLVCSFCDMTGHAEATCYKKADASTVAKAKSAEYKARGGTPFSAL